MLLPFDNLINGECLMLTTSDNKFKINETISKTLSDSSSFLSKLKKEKLTKLIIKNAGIICREATDSGSTEVLDHKIDTKEATPYRMARRRILYFQKLEV